MDIGNHNLRVLTKAVRRFASLCRLRLGRDCAVEDDGGSGLEEADGDDENIDTGLGYG
jgi:hypothetical protein